MPDRSVAVVPGRLQPGQVRRHDLVIAGQGEDEGDIDADPFGESLDDGLRAFPGCWDLDVEVGPVHQPPQGLGLGNRPVAVVGDPRVHLTRHPSIQAGGALVHWAQHVAAPPHVVRLQRPDRLTDCAAAQGQVPDLLVVGVAGRQRLPEDRRVGRDADDVLAGYQGWRGYPSAGALGTDFRSSPTLLLFGRSASQPGSDYACACHDSSGPGRSDSGRTGSQRHQQPGEPEGACIRWEAGHAPVVPAAGCSGRQCARWPPSRPPTVRVAVPASPIYCPRRSLPDSRSRRDRAWHARDRVVAAACTTATRR